MMVGLASNHTSDILAFEAKISEMGWHQMAIHMQLKIADIVRPTLYMYLHDWYMMILRRLHHYM